MEDGTIIKLTKRVLIEDLKKPELTSRERADLIFSYRKSSGEKVEDLAKELGISPTRISQYCSFADAAEKDITKCETLNQFLKENKFGLYQWIEEGYRNLTKIKKTPILTQEQKRKCKILSAKLSLFVDEEEFA